MTDSNQGQETTQPTQPTEPAPQNVPTGDVAPAGQAKDGQPAGVATPVTYEAFKLPEGVTFEPAQLTAVTEFAQAANLPQEQAQKLVDLGVSFAGSLQQQLEATIKTEIEAQHAKWLADAKADPEIGGAKYDASVRAAQEAIARCRPGLKALLDTFGIGNHPDVIHAFAQFGKAMQPDTMTPATTSGAGDPGPRTMSDVAKKFYPNMQSVA